MRQFFFLNGVGGREGRLRGEWNFNFNLILFKGSNLLTQLKMLQVSPLENVGWLRMVEVSPLEYVGQMIRMC